MEFMRRGQELVDTTEDQTQLLNLQFFAAEVGTFVTGFPFSGFFYPISYLEGVQVDFEKLAEWAALESLQDYRDLVKRSPALLLTY